MNKNMKIASPLTNKETEMDFYVLLWGIIFSIVGIILILLCCAFKSIFCKKKLII